jgi:hypothetical protein
MTMSKTLLEQGRLSFSKVQKTSNLILSETMLLVLKKILKDLQRPTFQDKSRRFKIIIPQTAMSKSLSEQICLAGTTFRTVMTWTIIRV